MPVLNAFSRVPVDRSALTAKLNHLIRLSKKSIGLVAEDFGTRDAPSLLDRSIVDGLVNFDHVTERKSVLVVVTGLQRASCLELFISKIAPTVNVVIAKDSITSFLKDENVGVVIARASIVEESLDNGTFTLEDTSLLVFDEAQNATNDASPIPVIMRNHFKKLNPRTQPRVFAIVSQPSRCHLGAISRLLHVDFPAPQVNNVRFRLKPSHVDNRYPFRLQFFDVTGGPASYDGGEAASGLGFVAGELGAPAAVIYQNWFSSSGNRQQHRIMLDTFAKNEGRLLVCLSHKANVFLGIICQELKKLRDKMSAIVFVEAPIIAVTLQLLMTTIPRYNILKIKVVLGENFFAESIGDEGRTIQIRDIDSERESINGFSTGQVNVLIIASKNMKSITDNYVIPSSPLIIDFDASVSNDLNEALSASYIERGEESRLVVFRLKKETRSHHYRGSRERRKRKREEFETATPPEKDLSGKPSNETASPEPVSKSSPKEHRKEKRQKRSDEPKVLAPLYQKAARALIGPSGVEDEVSHLYAMLLPSEKTVFDPFSRNIARPRSHFGVVLSEKLEDDDLTLDMRNFGYVTKASAKNVELAYLGPLSLATETLALIREYMAELFSNLFGERIPKQSFNWGVSKIEKEGYTRDFLFNYLVVPLISDNVKSCLEEGNALGTIAFGKMAMLRMEKRSIGHHPPETFEKMSAHIDELEGNVICGAKGFLPAIAGYAQHSKSPMSEFLFSKRFPLKKDGSFVDNNDEDIRNLVDAYEIPDEDGIAEPCGIFPKRVDPHTNKSQKYSPKSNRASKRAYWFGSINSNWVRYVLHSMEEHVVSLHQPMLLTTVPQIMTMDMFCDLLTGTPLRTVVCELVEKCVSAKIEPWKFLRVPETMRVHPVLSVEMLYLPCLLMNLERHVLLCELRKLLRKFNHVNIPLGLIREAVTSFSVSRNVNYERLELLGDAVLDLSATVHIYAENSQVREGEMHNFRKDLVCNEKLGVIAEKEKLVKYLNFKQRIVKEWVPPGAHREGTCVILNEKSLADVTEALCGAMYLSGYFQEEMKTGEQDCNVHSVTRGSLCPKRVVRAYKVGAQFLEGIGVFESAEPSQLAMLRSTICTLRGNSTTAARTFPKNDSRVEKNWEQVGRPMEEKLQYKFKNRELLFLACTHKSYARSINRDYWDAGFQRLEFLGDAIAGFIVIANLYNMFEELGPGALTELKGLCVSNETFARITVKHKLDNYFYIESGHLKHEIANFKAAIDPHQSHRFGDNVTEIGAPKALGDLFEALIGAVFVDSGMESAWNVAMHLMKETLEEKADPRKFDLPSSVHVIQYVQRNLGFSNCNIVKKHKKLCRKDRDTFVTTLTLLEEVIGVGRGTNKKLSQSNAYDRALKDLKEPDDAMKEKIGRMRANYSMSMPSAGGSR